LYFYRVRILWSVLAIYFLSLSFVNVCEDGAQEETVMVEIHDSEPCDDEEDDCTPFCMCSCCGINLTPLTSAAIDIPKTSIVSKEYSNYITYLLPQAYADFWQPPRIG
jgi:hypothetical protein